MKDARTIDKSKKSNHRCVNCAHWAKKRSYGRSIWDHAFWCDTGGRSMDYWNCCSKFEWNQEKQYKEANECPLLCLLLPTNTNCP